MATIKSTIELQDNFTGILNNIINSVNMSLSVMEDLNATMNNPVDTTSLEAARDTLNQAAIAAQQLDEALQGAQAPTPQAPTAPIQWQSDTMDVFSSSGTARFQQEIQSANNMLNTLNQTQNKIAQTAAKTDLFPDNAISDMNNMQNRLQAIQQRIQAIESNPINMTSPEASAELEQLRGQLNQAVQEQQNLNRAVDNMDVQAANDAYLRLSNTVSNTERYIRDNTDEQGRFNREIEEGTQEANQFTNVIKGAVASYATLQGLSTALNLSDQLTTTTARLNLMNDGLQNTEELQNLIFASAERSRGSYQATAAAVSKLGVMAADAFDGSEEIVGFMELVNKQFTIAGTEAAGVDAAMLQLTQAMASGVLRGEELNSIFEQAPTIIQTIADYLDVPIGSIRSMAAEGQITADVVKSAMFASADATNAKFESMPKTFSQIWTSFQNNALMAFQPILQKMSEIANSEAFQSFVSGAIEALSTVAGVALEIFNLLVSVASVVVENWSWISPIIYGIAGALAVYYGYLLLTKAAALAAAAGEAILTGAKMLAVPVYAALTGATMADTAAQWGLNAALYACPIIWIIILIIALIALFYAVIAAINKFAGTSISATGAICGAFMVALAIIGNIFVTLWNLVVDVFVLIYNLIADVANFIGNVFKDPVGAVCRLFFDLADTVLGVLQALASAIDTIFGSNLSGGVQGWRDSLSGWVDKTFGEGEEVMAKMDASSMKLGRFEYGKAWDSGYSFGQGIGESVSNFNPSSLFDTSVPGADNYANLGNAANTELGGLGGVGSGVNDIANNTGEIADSMDITEEDLKYLRDIAEQEAINRYTTAEVTIDQTNHNNISSKMDLDGVISGLTDAANEAAYIIAEGVHD